MIPDASLALPVGWELTAAEAQALYSNPIIAALLEGMPNDPVVVSFHDWMCDDAAKNGEKCVTTEWGMPDFSAAMATMDVTRAEMADALQLDPATVEMLELGMAIPTLSGLACMAHDLGWPLAVFFRSVSRHLHRRTHLGRLAGLPSIIGATHG